MKKRIRDFSTVSDKDKVIDGALDDAEGLVLNQQEGSEEDEEYTLDGFDDDDDVILLADEDDEDDDEFDGIFEEFTAHRNGEGWTRRKPR